MKQDQLLDQIRQAVHEIEPAAEIILYGSRSRGDAGPESDWDLLVLVDGLVDDERTDRIRHRLYEVEWSAGTVISAIVRSHQEWKSKRYQGMPFYQQVEAEGIRI
ncbi:MAG: nucleotidyltransferase domain-containing protein [Thermodesulfobacteriota bacterium]